MAPGSASGKSEFFFAGMRSGMQAVVISFGSGWRFDWTSTMNAEPTAENRPACVHLDPVLVTGDGEGD